MYGFSAYSQVAYSALPTTSGGGGNTYNEFVTDSVSFSDPVVSATISQTGAVAETVTGTDAQNTTINYVVAVAEATVVSDTVAATAIFVASLAETITVSDAELISSAIPTSINEAVTATAVC